MFLVLGIMLPTFLMAIYEKDGLLSIFALLFPQLACPCTHANETSKS